MFLNIAIYIFALFIHTSTSETCLPFLKNKSEFRKSIYLNGRIWRFNASSGESTPLIAMKPNISALCSVDFANDLKGKTLRVAVVPIYPYVVMGSNNKTVTGFFGDAWTTLEETLKFRSIYLRFRRRSPKILEDGNVDVLLAPSLFRSYSSSYHSYSVSIIDTSYSLFMLSKGTKVSKWWYLKIFTPGVWLTAAIFVILLTALIKIIYNFKTKLCGQNKNCAEFNALSYNLLCILGATSGQGFQTLPKPWSLRLITVSTLIMGMLLSCGFNSTLTSYLAYRTPSVPFTELLDVVKKKTHSLCVRNGSTAQTALIDDELHDEKSGASPAEWRQVINKDCPDMNNRTDFTSKICIPGFAYLEVSHLFMDAYQHVKEQCHIVPCPREYWNNQLSVLHYSGSKYRHIIDKYLLRIKSSGIAKYLEQKWVSKESTTQPARWNSFHPVELGHILLLLLGLSIMAIISGIICIIENIWFHIHSSDMQKLSLSKI